MQGLHVWIMLAVVFAWPTSHLDAGQPLVADVTVNRIGQPVVMVDRRGLQTPEIEISSPGAEFIKLHFSEFDLPPGVFVEVSAVSGTEGYRYSMHDKDAFTFDPEIGEDGRRTFSAMSVGGDRVRVRLVGDIGAIDGRHHALTIGHYLEGLPDSDPQSSGSSPPIDSPCGIDQRQDAACWAPSSPEFYSRSRPVGKVLTSTGIVCTAWRVGPQNRIFTAEHCIASQADVSAAEVWFNYEANECGGQHMATVTKVSGAALLAVDPVLDFALFTVNGFEDIAGFGYLGLEVREGQEGERIYIPQHGYGHPKQIAVQSDMNDDGWCAIDDENHNGYGLNTDLGYYCDTVASSSGSPVVVAATGRVIALHHLGGCVNSGAKMSLIWPLVEPHFGGQVPPGNNEPILHNVPPQAAISVACIGLRCAFSGAASRDSDGDIVKYEWDFGDGRTAAGGRVRHGYLQSGTYEVRLTVTDNRGARGSTVRPLSLGSTVKPPPPPVKPRG